MDEKDTALPLAGKPIDLSSAIDTLLARPDLIATVASALGKPPPSVSLPSAHSDAETSPLEAIAERAPTEHPTPEAISAIAPLLSSLSGLSGLSGGKKGAPPKSNDPRVCLLLALKPYLSASRCEVIDTMVRLSTVTELLRGLPSGLDTEKGGR